MAATQINSPRVLFVDATGIALDDGAIYIGADGADPEVTPKAVFTDEALSTPISQPIATLKGRAVSGTTPVNLYVDGRYSIRTRNSLGVQVDYVQSVSGSIVDALAGSGGASLIGFIQSGAGAVASTAQTKLREVVSITDFGASPSATAAVNTAAFHAAMTVLLDRFPNDVDYYPGGPGNPTDFADVDRQTGKIYIPAGDYLVSPSIFSSLSHPRAPFCGFNFEGDGKMSSVLILETGGADTWFYDNGTGNLRYQQITWMDIGFRSDDYTKGNLMRMWSDGGPKQPHFVRCDFQYLQKCLETSGTGNADLSLFRDCTGFFYGSILTLDNDQSVVHNFGDSHLGTYGHYIHVKTMGGGNVRVIGGSIDFIWHEDYSPPDGNFMFYEDDDAAVGPGNCTFTFEGCRVETEAYMRRTHIRAATTTAGFAAGVSTVNLASSGTGAIAIGDKVRFGTDPTNYTVTAGDADVSNGGAISFTPALVNAIPASTTVIYTNEPPFGLVRTADHPNDGVPRVIFDKTSWVNCQTYLIDAGGAILSASYRRIIAVHAFPTKHVEFRNCTLSKAFFYAFGGERDEGSPNAGGIVTLSNCFDGITGELPSGDSALENIHARVLYAGSCGRLITTGMEEHTTGSSFVRKILDADPYWRNGFAREPGSLKKVTNIKHLANGWPLAANDTQDSYIDAPSNLFAFRIFVLKPAVGASTNAYQLHLKVTDRTGSIVASSTLAQFKDVHTFDLSHIEFAGVTRLCLCASGAGTDFDSGTGFTYIEYA